MAWLLLTCLSGPRSMSTTIIGKVFGRVDVSICHLQALDDFLFAGCRRLSLGIAGLLRFGAFGVFSVRCPSVFDLASGVSRRCRLRFTAARTLSSRRSGRCRDGLRRLGVGGLMRRFRRLRPARAGLAFASGWRHLFRLRAVELLAWFRDLGRCIGVAGVSSQGALSRAVDLRLGATGVAFEIPACDEEEKVVVVGSLQGREALGEAWRSRRGKRKPRLSPPSLTTQTCENLFFYIFSLPKFFTPRNLIEAVQHTMRLSHSNAASNRPQIEYCKGLIAPPSINYLRRCNSDGDGFNKLSWLYQTQHILHAMQ
ncbi:hypothetical protein KC329_g28 [Hortaea werneckii]|nr:hypothetical protein KC329_g28 [Hortaea werneckii]